MQQQKQPQPTLPKYPPRFSSLPVPFPDDPTTVYALNEFPPLALFDATTVYPALAVPTRHTAHYKRLLTRVLVQGRKNVLPFDPEPPKQNVDRRGSDDRFPPPPPPPPIETVCEDSTDNVSFAAKSAFVVESKNLVTRISNANNRRILLLQPGTPQSHPDVVRALTTAPSTTTTNEDPNYVNVNNEYSRVEWLPLGVAQTLHYADYTTTHCANAVDTLLRKLLLSSSPSVLQLQPPPESSLSHQHPPLESEIPSSFETVGHICHLNLRPEWAPYKYWIGKVILDCQGPTISVVVNKTATLDHEEEEDCKNNIDTIQEDDKDDKVVKSQTSTRNNMHKVYRTFPMEILASTFAASSSSSPTKTSTDASSQSWSVTTVREHGCSFRLDYQHVYWNSRLSGEHLRIVQAIQAKVQNDGDERVMDNNNNIMEDENIVVADAMAGVGPFAVPLTAPHHRVKKTKPKKHASDDSSAAESSSSPAVDNSTQNPRPSKRHRIQQQEQHGGQTVACSDPNSPTAKKCSITVYANDLNPTSFHYLQINGRTNQCRNLHCSNLDARQFLHDLSDQVPIVHEILLNLPATAPEFLDALRGWPLPHRPIVRVYCFAPKPLKQLLLLPPPVATILPINNNNNIMNSRNCGDATTKPLDLTPDIAGEGSLASCEALDQNQGALNRCSLALGCPLDVIRDSVVFHIVRDISPRKNMVCVSFRLPLAAQALPRIPLQPSSRI